jgi:hypothetical protein
MLRNECLVTPERQGHEGLGRVISVGDKVKMGVSVGDIVSTCSGGSFSTEYLSKVGEFKKVNICSKRYITEPIACAINIIDLGFDTSTQDQYCEEIAPKDVLIIGSGFLATMAYLIIRHYEKDVNVVILGNYENSFLPLGEEQNFKESYPLVIDLSERENCRFDLTEKFGNYVIACEKDNLIDNKLAIWKGITLIHPTTGSKKFKQAFSDSTWYVNFIPEKLFSYFYNYEIEITGEIDSDLNRLNKFLHYRGESRKEMGIRKAYLKFRD